MSANKLLQAAAGAGGESVYVEDVFSTYLYGAEGTNPTIQTGIDMSEDGGMVWIKNRDAVEFPSIIDTERTDGSLTSWLATASSDVESSGYSSGISATFPTNGFTVSGTRDNLYNNSDDFVSWNFKKQAGFFDVVTWTGDGSQPRAINHNLGSVPGFIIVKRTDTTGSWQCRHRSLASDGRMVLNTTGTEQNNAQFFFGDGTNAVAATSTQFTVADDAEVNASGGTYVAYLFAHDDQSFGDDSDESIIKCGSYSGNGLTTGNEITLGFEPQWLLVKRTDSSNNWMMMDIMRGITDSSNNYLRANTSDAEQATGSAVAPTATGFNLLTDTSSLNNSSGTYIYIAIRRPMKTPEAGTEVFAVDTRGSSSGEPNWKSGFVTDWAFITDVSQASNRLTSARLIQGKNLDLNNTNAESTNSNYAFDYMNGFFSSTSVNSNFYGWLFKRATGFFDVVAYTGTGSNRTIAHNLGVAPEMMIIKARESLSPYVAGWVVYHSGISPADSIYLNQDGGSSGASFQFASTAPTSSVFTLGSAVDVNMSGKDFISFHFATLAGISKVGSYTGTGSNVDVDCGFSAGARFILIKRTDSSGDWYVYDSTRGIVAGNDPYLLINSTAAEVTSTDYIDPLSSGFTVTSSAPAALNNSGGTYIFLAIA